MLVIRKAQMDTLDACSREVFRRRMLQHIATDFPSRAAELGADGTRRLVETSIAKALDYGISSEDDLQLYLDLALDLGPGFEDQPDMAWAQQILQNQSLSGHAKVEMIRKLR